MKSALKYMLAAGLGLSLAACATPPDELVQARSVYSQAAENQTVRENAPAELREAELALKDAEKEYEDEGNDLSTRSLAYVADRKARLAVAIANKKQAINEREFRQSQLLEETEKSRQEAKQAYQGAQVQIYMTRAELEKQKENYAEAKQNLAAMSTDLEQARQSGEYTEQQLAALEKELAVKRQSLDMMSKDLEMAEKERLRLEGELEKAQGKLSEFAKVAQERESMIITLNGSVLFKVGEYELMPIAKNRLDEVATVLLEQKDRSIVVEGHTDSQGSTENNIELSRNRAMSVRNYLITKGVPSDLIIAQGMGEQEPIASNDTPEGRANNRRVEIIVSNSSVQASTTPQVRPASNTVTP